MLTRCVYLRNCHAQSCSSERIGSNPGLASFPLACRLELPQVDSHPLWLEGHLLHLLTHNHPNMYFSTYWICRYMHDGGAAAQKRPAGGPVCRMWPVRKFSTEADWHTNMTRCKTSNGCWGRFLRVPAGSLWLKRHFGWICSHWWHTWPF